MGLDCDGHDYDGKYCAEQRHQCLFRTKKGPGLKPQVRPFAFLASVYRTLNVNVVVCVVPPPVPVIVMG
jgi:hypothetical protein